MVTLDTISIDIILVFVVIEILIQNEMEETESEFEESSAPPTEVTEEEKPEIRNSSSNVSSTSTANDYRGFQRPRHSNSIPTNVTLRKRWQIYPEGYIEDQQWDIGEEREETEEAEKEPCKSETDENLLPESKEKSESGSGTSSDALSNVYAKLSPFFPKWSFGISRDVELINLTTTNTFEVFCVASHFGIIYNYLTNTMTFLPGHNFPVRSISADAKGRFLVTSDSGEDNVIIIWDNLKRLPVWCLYNVFPKGVKYAKISQDARFLGAINCGFNYRLRFWMWTYGKEEPDGDIEINPKFGKAKHIDFNHLNTEQFVVTADIGVVFCEWSKAAKSVHTYTPEFRLQKKKVGIFRESIFLDDNHSALTTTSQGFVIVWCDVKYSDPIIEELGGTIEKNYLKTVRLHKTGITSIRLCDRVLITSSAGGTIFFHDQQLRLVYWFPVKLDPLISISVNIDSVSTQFDPFSDGFNERVSSSNEEVQNMFEFHSDTPDISVEEEINQILDENTKSWTLSNPSDCGVDSRPFSMRDFIFLTNKGKVGYVSHKRQKVKYYLYDTEASILSVDCNPNKSHMVVGNSHGDIMLYDYKMKKILVSKSFQSAVTTLKYSQLGHDLIAGLQDGQILELDPNLLDLRGKRGTSKSPVLKLCFSPNDSLLAYFDQSYTVHVYSRKGKSKRWNLVGNYISHYKPIVDIHFQNNLKTPRLFSIGQDRTLVEYDLSNVEDSKLTLLNRVRIEQTAVPTCFVWLQKFYKTPQILVSNDEYKLKVYDAQTYVCQKTTLGPTADTPINFMKLIMDDDQSTQFGKMIYKTEKHIGLKLLPPTGNPFEGLGIIAHPKKIVSMAISYDYRYVFTAGLGDINLLMWEVNANSVEVASHMGGTGLEPFVSLIEGGPNGFLFKEIEDFFYYAQIIHQGEDPNMDRSVSKNLALCEIPDMFRALGYFPTDQEVNDLIHELKHVNYENTGTLTDEVTFEECVISFLNHRPVHGTCLTSINNALLKIADLTDPSDVIVERDELYKALEQRAEGMPHAEVIGYLCILLLPKDENNPIPPSMSLSDFAETVLGIDLTITEDQVRQITHAFETKIE